MSNPIKLRTLGMGTANAEHMTDPVLQLVTQGVFVFAFVLTLVDYLRRPALQRLELAILFGCLTPIIVLQLISHTLGEVPTWVSALATRGITHARLVAIAVGSGCLGAVIVVAGVATAFPSATPATEPISNLLALGS